MRYARFMGPALLLGGLLLAAPGQAGEKAALDGALLVKERCTICHDAGRIDKARKDRKGWEKTTDRMIAKGAKLDKEQREAVLAYLSGR